MTFKDSGAEQAGFRFLFRNDRGVIDRSTWWKGTLPLVIIAAAARLGWSFVRPYTEDGLHPLTAVAAYLYLVAFGFATILLLVCEYNLSAKRFSDLRRPRALAAVLPLSLLFAGAFDWYLPRSDGALPQWSAWPVLGALLAVLLWNVFELGIRTSRPG